MKIKRRVLLILLPLLVIAVSAILLIFGLPAMARQIDNIIQSGPGAIVTALFSVAAIYYCLLPILGILLLILILWTLYKVFKQ